MNRLNLIILRCFVGVWLTAPANLLAQPVLYVDLSATGMNTGLSWCDGFTQLNDAVQHAVNNPGQFTEIRVARGTYVPTDAVPAPRDSTFYMANGVKIKGGYKGGSGGNCNDPSANERNITLYETILSGDINTPLVQTDNCYTVVTAQQPNGLPLVASAELDGFTIRDGYNERWYLFTVSEGRFSWGFSQSSESNRLRWGQLGDPVCEFAKKNEGSGPQNTVNRYERCRSGHRPDITLRRATAAEDQSGR